MPHQVSEKCKVVVLLKKILGVSVTERMRIDDLRVDSVLHGEMLELLRNAACGNDFAITVPEYIPAREIFIFEPLDSLLAKPSGNVEPPDLAAFRIHVEVSGVDMFNFYLEQLADSGSGCRHEPHDEIPFQMSVSFELLFQEFIVGIADDVLQEVLLLNLDKFELQLVFLDEFQVSVQCLKPQVDCLRLEMFNKETFVCKQVLLVHLAVFGEKMVRRPDIGRDCVLGQV